MGTRKLRAWLQQPIRDRDLICQRQDRVGALMLDDICTEVATVLGRIHDMERIVTRVLLGSVQPRELERLRLSLECLPELIDLLRRACQGQESHAAALQKHA